MGREAKGEATEFLAKKAVDLPVDRKKWKGSGRDLALRPRCGVLSEFGTDPGFSFLLICSQ